MKWNTILAVVLGTLVLTAAPVAAQEDPETTERSLPPLGFSLGLTLGVTTFEDPEDGSIDTYQLLGIRPEFTLGRLGIGLDLPVNYRFTGGDGNDEFEVREDDWVPDDDTSFLELYLPKFRYVRYGRKGEDIYARLGGIPAATIGNGFIVNNYSNEQYLPDRRIFGAVFDLDSALAGIDYFGVESLVSNLAAWDLMAARFYVRPLVGVPLPLLPSMQIGVTVATDQNPYYFWERDPASPLYNLDAPNDTVLMWGLDVRQPVLAREAITMAVFGDLAFQEDRLGGMVGAGGRIAGFLIYGAQIRAVEDNFVPSYFDGTYDRRRVERLAIYEEAVDLPGGVGWLGRMGFALLGDAIIFDNTLEGPFDPGDGNYPQLRSSLAIAEGVVPGFAGLSAEASYTKFDLREFDDLTTAENAIIGARINVRSGPVVISLLYDLTYDPLATGDDQWVVSSGLETTITF